MTTEGGRGRRLKVLRAPVRNQFIEVSLSSPLPWDPSPAGRLQHLQQEDAQFDPAAMVTFSSVDSRWDCNTKLN